MRTKLSNSLWGLFFIVIGLGFLGNVLFDWNFNIFFDGWWTLFLIIPCAISIIQNNFHVGNTVGLCIGVLLLLGSQGLFIDGYTARKLVFPLIFIIIGLGILFRNMFGGPRDWASINARYHEDGVDYTSIFSGQKIVYPNEPFKGATINAIFGGTELDLRNAIITEDVVVNYTAIFGGGDVFVPSNVKVKVTTVPIFGGVSNKAASSTDQNAPVVYVNATCIFGGIDIK